MHAGTSLALHLVFRLIIPLLQEPLPNPKRSGNDSHFVEVRRDGTTAEWSITGTPVQISHIKDGESADSISPPISLKETKNDRIESITQVRIQLLTYNIL